MSEHRFVGGESTVSEELQSIILVLAALAETRGHDELGVIAHSVRLRRYVEILVGELARSDSIGSGLPAEWQARLITAAPLHDVGMSRVPERILMKEGRLNSEELREMRRHTTYGRDALAAAQRQLGTIPVLEMAAEIAYSHHEMWNGQGYPRGLIGEDIPLSGRIVAVADVYDALITARPYKPAYTHEQACTIIRDGRGTHLDPRIVDAFLSRNDELAAIAEANPGPLTKETKLDI